MESKPQPTMAEERKAEWSIATNAVQTILGNAGDLVDCVAAEVRKLLGLQTAPYLLGRLRSGA